MRPAGLLLLAVLWHATLAGATPAANGARAVAELDPDQCPRVTIGMELLAQGGDETVLYRGEHVRTQDGPLLRTEERFTDRAGRVVMRSESAYDRKTLVLEHYRRDNPSDGGATWLRVTPQGLELGKREDADSVPRTRTLPRDGGALLGAALVDFMRKELETLADGRSLGFHLLVPGRLERYRFRVKRTSLPGPEQADRRVLLVEPESFLMRQFVNPLLFVFESQAPHRLLEFRGQSTIHAPELHNQPVRIVYRYPDAC
jgi:hypothetical protein